MNLNIAIVDDQEADRDALRSGISAWRDMDSGRDGAVLCFSSGEELIEHFTPCDAQLVFMDIYMNGLNGIETAKKLRAADAGVLIVFLTSSDDFAFDAFPIHPFDYIVKPCGTEKLYGVLDEAMRALTPPEQSITVRVVQNRPFVANGVYSVPLDNISAIASQKHVVEINMANGENLLSNMTFAEIEGMISGDRRFLACNRGLLVNMDHVSSINGDTFMMKNGSQCPIRVRGRTKIVSDFSQYRITRMRGGAA